MAKNEAVLGVYVAHGRLSLAVKSGRKYKTVWVNVPSNIVKRGEFLSKNLFAEFIKDTMKENGIRMKKAAFVIAAERVLIREVNVPKMNDEQLRFNLPYEFRDYIRGELKDYMFDYAWRPPLEGEEANSDGSLKILAVAMPASYYSDLTEIFQMAGLKVVKAVPEPCIIERLIKEYPTDAERNLERCFLDIGVHTIRMQVFKNGRYKISHIIDVGEEAIARAVADSMNVDMQLARTYIDSNYENCLSSESVINAYKDISLEVLKGFNYYEMSDMSSRLNDVVIYGPGARIKPFVDILKERITMNVTTLGEAFPEFNGNGDFDIAAPAAGILAD